MQTSLLVSAGIVLLMCAMKAKVICQFPVCTSKGSTTRVKIVVKISVYQYWCCMKLCHYHHYDIVAVTVTAIAIVTLSNTVVVTIDDTVVVTISVTDIVTVRVIAVLSCHCFCPTGSIPKWSKTTVFLIPVLALEPQRPRQQDSETPPIPTLRAPPLTRIRAHLDSTSCIKSSSPLYRQ